MDSLLTNVRGIIFAHDAIQPTLAPHFEEVVKSFVGFLKRHGLEPQKDKSGYRVEIRQPQAQELQLIAQEINSLSHRVSTVAAGYLAVRRALLLALVSHWDVFIGDILKAIFALRPGIIAASEQTLTLADLSQFASLEEARDHIVDAEVEKVLRNPHAWHFAYIEKQLSMPAKPRPDLWCQFLEMTERRNLIAHTGGVISRSYLKNCAALGIPVEDGAKLGIQLHVEEHYLMSACDCIVEMAVELGHAIWRKNVPSEQAAAERHYHNVTYRLINDGRYRAAIMLLEFALKPPMKHTTIRNRMIDTINVAQAYKWSGDQSKAMEVISREDWSASSQEFALAIAVLKDDFSDAARIMQVLGSEGKVSRADYQMWPLFQKFRETTEFVGAYERVFGETAEVREISAEAIEGKAGHMRPHGDAADPD